jgi:hypothetical protein
MKKQDTAGIGADIDVTNAVCLEQSFGDAGGEPVGSHQGGQPGARPASSRNVQRREDPGALSGLYLPRCHRINPADLPPGSPTG